MRPQKLVLQAFGPYAGKEIIDFTQLENRNMFVISGKTGAGKTTIFDGISFAIFGKASGDDRSAPDMRSHFADSSIMTEVSLTFQLRERTYHIWRSPMQEKQKKSGEGFTTINARAELFEVKDGVKELLAANVRDVDEKIKDIIGLDAVQFKQILMIPQGEFKKLLTSESKEKESILQKLFHTQMYKRMEEKLKEKSSFLKKEEEKIQLELSSCIEDIRWFEQASEQEENPAGTSKETLSRLKKDIERTESRLDDLKIRQKEAENKEKAINEQLFKANQIVSMFKEKEQLSEAKEQLANQQEQMNKDQESIKWAQKASTLEKQEQSYIRIGKRVNESKKQIEALKARAEHAKLAVVSAHERYKAEESKKEDRERAANEWVNLQEMKKDVLAFTQLEEETRMQSEEWKKNAQALSIQQQKLKDLHEELERLKAQIAGCEKADMLYAQEKHMAEQLEEGAELSKQIEQQIDNIKILQEQLKEKEELITVQKNKEQESAQQLDHLQEQLFASHAVLLASHLRAGESCAVCGSKDHPNPARHHGGDVTQEMYDRFKRKKDEQTELLQKALREYDRMALELQTLRGNCHKDEEKLQAIVRKLHLEGDEVKQQLEDGLAASTDKLKQLEQQIEQLPALKEAFEKKFEIDRQLQKTVEELQEKESKQKEKHIQLETRLQSMKERVPEYLRSYASYEQALRKAEELKNKLQQQLEQAQGEWQKLLQEEAKVKSTLEAEERNIGMMETELNEQRALFKTEMEKQGFQTYAMYDSAKRTEEELNGMQAAIDAYNREMQRIASLLAEMEKKLSNVAMPDIEEIKAQLQAAQDLNADYRRKVNDLAILLANNLRINGKLSSGILKQDELQNQYRQIGHLYEISKGQNPFRITFERFVLTSFLDDILLEANERLTKMTSGRYSLIRKVDPTRKNIQSGLELSVFDQYTGMERHVKTLSGGESFKASLSLALGLAAVVQQNAGGISLETMFIDEGFGTLDPESLDQAVESLLEIQSSGRLVGIISHVPELKERIDARLEVRGTQTGSTTKFVLN
ncbi:AAA family ATPase [Bacillus testis]|uniref:AAA family ATPase n=1 Tax=Bacillus testis TaxID=1622072 RepID=UPI00067F70A0|nr:SMC family ATPase [Bacillus testis]